MMMNGRELLHLSYSSALEDAIKREWLWEAPQEIEKNVFRTYLDMSAAQHI